MTDSRPEITAKADGEKVVIQFRHKGIHFSGADIALSPQECFVLQCQLSAAYKAVAEQPILIARIAVPESNAVAAFRVDNGYRLESPSEEEAKPETWHDREPML